MQNRWVLTQYYKDDNGHSVPVAADYGGKWYAPIHASSDKEWGLVQVYLNHHQIEAMGSDDRVYLCPLLFDPRPISPRLAKIFSGYGATATMSFAALLATLSDIVPHYGVTI